MFEVLGSWLDWKKSEVQAAVSNAAFNHHCNKIEKDYAKNPSTYISKPQETKKPESKETVNNVTEVKEEKPDTSVKTQDIDDKDVAETAKMFAESFDKILNDSKNLDDIMDDGLKDIVESIKKYQQKKQEHADAAVAKVNDPDPAEAEHPEDDVSEEANAEEPVRKIIDLKLQDSKRLLDVIYQVILENAEELLKYTVADDENISEEEKKRRNENYDRIVLTSLAKELTGLEDVSNVDLKALETDLKNKLGEGNIAGATKGALTYYTENNIPDGKPLDLTKNRPMEIVGDPEEESPTQEPSTDPTEPALNSEPAAPANNNSSTRRNSRRKK